MGTTLLEKSKAVVEDIRNSEYAVKSKYVHLGLYVCVWTTLTYFVTFSQELAGKKIWRNEEQSPGNQLLNVLNQPNPSSLQAVFYAIWIEFVFMQTLI